MSRKKLRIHNTDVDNLVSNLRGEIGEMIFTWGLMRDLMVKASHLRTNDVAKNMENLDLCTLRILIGKLNDEIVARLSELAEQKVGRLTFHFAQVKLGQFQSDVAVFARFVESSRFREKRNYNISHKELPEQWSEHKHIHIPYPTVLKGIALALRLMKKIDRKVLGPSAPYLWREMRKRRDSPTNPVKASYMLLPYLRLSERERAKIIFQEMTEGETVWVDMETKVDGVEVTMKACKKWGAFLLGPQMIILREYPLQKLDNITTAPSSDEQSISEGDPPPEGHA